MKQALMWNNTHSLISPLVQINKIKQRIWTKPLLEMLAVVKDKMMEEWERKKQERQNGDGGHCDGKEIFTRSDWIILKCVCYIMFSWCLMHERPWAFVGLFVWLFVCLLCFLLCFFFFSVSLLRFCCCILFRHCLTGTFLELLLLNSLFVCSLPFQMHPWAVQFEASSVAPCPPVWGQSPSVAHQRAEETHFLSQHSLSHFAAAQ